MALRQTRTMARPKIILLATTTLDGFIADTNCKLEFNSSENLARFKEDSTQIGTAIMGHKTYLAIGSGLPNRRNIVYSNSQIKLPDAEITNLPPTQLIQKLAEGGLENIAVIGGQKIYTLFAEAGLIDELWLTIEPKILGVGKTIFKSPLKLDLKLTHQEILNTDGAQYLRYKINKM